MTGTWKIRCAYPDGTIADTTAMNLDASTHTIQRHISETCPLMRNRILVHSYGSPYPHHSLGKEFFIDFTSYNEDPGQYTVITNEDDPLVGADIQFEGTTVIPYGKNLMFWPIPFEMLNTYEEKPQMIVEIDSKPAVCHSMSCGFTHVPAVGEITSFAITENPWKLTVSGTELPDNLSKIQSISIAASTCTVQGAGEDGSLSGTSIECLLDREPVCGDWEPLVTTFFGNVPM
jgi:hypothetical protein